MSPSVEPFDEAKYKDLMDGLEIIEVQYKNLKKIIDYRIEAEFFSKRFMRAERLLQKTKCRPFASVATAQNGRAYSSEAFSSDGDLFISKIGDVTNKRTVDMWEKLSSREFAIQNGTFLHDGDILMTLTGDPPDVGKVNLIETNGNPCTWNQRVARINKSSNDFLSNYSLYAVLSTEICRMQMERFAKGIRQRNLGNDCFSFVNIPLLDDYMQKAVDKIVEKHIKTLDEAKSVYAEAEIILFDFLGVPIVSGQSLPVTTYKQFTDSFKKTGRLDAEYYQPKYEALAQKLNTSETVLSLCNLHDKNFKPDEEKTYQYIELADVGQSGDISDVDIQYGSDLPTRARRIVKAGQIIVSSVEGSLQSCALITDEHDGSLCSNGFYVLDSDCINSETLLVLFKSEPIQALLKQRCSGTILTAISKDELLSMPLPMIDEDVQKVIAAKVQESFSLRRKSKQLLNYAKQAVEMAIEKGEDVALVWLKGKANEEV